MAVDSLEDELRKGFKKEFEKDGVVKGMSVKDTIPNVKEVI
jgi:hypothetical protein